MIGRTKGIAPRQRGRRGVCVLAVAAAMLAAGRAGAKDAAEILQAGGAAGGLVVHVGCGDPALTAGLRGQGRFLVHALDTDPAKVARARERIRSLGLYGPVSVALFDGRRLPYVDNLVNLIVAEDLGGVPPAEAMRVLAPGGAVLVRSGAAWKKTVKPWPREIDDWPQYLHGADNNAVSQDSVAGPPRHMQWLAAPAWSRSHMAIPTVVSIVSSQGRLFTIEDRTTTENPLLPGRFALIARDAFNGMELWTHPFAQWESVTRYVKDMAIQLQRRVAAAGPIVYCTPGLDAPLTAFDAATGKVLTTYAGTQRTQEFALHEGVLYAVVGDRMNAARYNIVKTTAGKGQNLGGSDPKAPFGGTGFRGAYAPEVPDRPNPTCEILALQAAGGKELWRKKGLRAYTACSLAIRGPYAVYQTAGGLFCLDRKTGRKVWSVDKNIPGGDGTEANTVVLSDTMVYAQEGSSLAAYSLKDGTRKWQAPIAGNYEKSADLFLAAGAVWTGGSKQPTSRDPLTGEQRTVIRQQMTGPMSHDRCYRNFITERYYVNSKTGGADFLDLATGKEFPHHWTRGTCGLGVLPCNGLLYTPPYSCQCSIGPMLQDFNALAPEPGLKSPTQAIPVARKVRLVKGPAYGKAGAPRPAVRDPQSKDWPTYRHDGSRGGATRANVPAGLAPLWEARLTRGASAPTIAEGKVFVADVDAHTVCALSAADGGTAWTYVAGGRVDSPPTWHEGLVLFGSRDGWVHCLRAADGVLVWRFKDLPDRLIGARGQLESAWPVSGSVLVKAGASAGAGRAVAYFAAGRSSFLDGGIFLYGLDPATGAVVHSRQVHGPFVKGTGFPAVGNQGSKADILVTDGELLYMRHKAFQADLTDAPSARAHVIPSAGFADAAPQHRTYWTIGTGFSGKTAMRGASGDILATDGASFYEVRGFPVQRHSYFDPRVKGYQLFAGTVGAAGPRPTAPQAKKKRRAAAPGAGGAGRLAGRAAAKWTADIPLTGKAIALAGEIVFVAGVPAHFPPDHPVEKYQAAFEGKLGGVLWAASAADGKKLAEYKLPAPPRWDGLAAADGRLYVSLKDGTVMCMGPAK